MCCGCRVDDAMSLRSQTYLYEMRTVCSVYTVCYIFLYIPGSFAINLSILLLDLLYTYVLVYFPIHDIQTFRSQKLEHTRFTDEVIYILVRNKARFKVCYQNNKDYKFTFKSYMRSKDRIYIEYCICF